MERRLTINPNAADTEWLLWEHDVETLPDVVSALISSGTYGPVEVERDDAERVLAWTTATRVLYGVTEHGVELTERH
jgi:hypothetical protein